MVFEKGSAEWELWRKKISNSLKGRTVSNSLKEWHEKGGIPWNKGKQWDETTRIKMSESAKLRKATHVTPHTEETKKVMSIKRKGFKPTKESLQKKSESMKKYWERRKS